MVRNPALRLALDELIGDGFAGGGGASLALEQALGRKVDIAINHDPEAVAMHKANHPDTEHYIEDIYDVDPVAVCKGRRPGVMWFSPDCTEHSRCKNGSIKRDRKVRCLANVIHVWAGSVRPRVIIVENVLEFEDWGPLDEDDKIDALRKGEYFKFWWRRMEHMGYRGEMRYLKACDYGAPTSRERLYIVWRCDGAEIGWPDVSHGPSGYEPYRTAAECIDYSLPCPSIFMTQEEASELYRQTGIRCNRPLSDNTMKRIGTGMWKHVLDAEKPFLIPTTHPGDLRTYDIEDPFRTVTAANRGEFAYVSPYLTPYYGQGGAHDCREAMRTSTTRARFGLAAPFIVPAKTWGGGGNNARSLEQVFRTVTCSKRGEYGIVAPTLVQTGYGERPGQAPRTLDLHKPLGTAVSAGQKHGLVAAFLTKEFSARAGGWNGGQDIADPFSTVTRRDHHRLALGHLVKFRGTSDAHLAASGLSSHDPLPTVTSGGLHFGEVRALLSRFGDVPAGDCVVMNIGGEQWAISDIGFRMLVARELFRAQGFPDSYIIDPLFDYVYVSKKGKRRVVTKPLTETAQIDKCGNSVSPPIARGIIAANFPLTARDVAPVAA